MRRRTARFTLSFRLVTSAPTILALEQVNEARRLKELERESAELKKMLAGTTVDADGSARGARRASQGKHNTRGGTVSLPRLVLNAPFRSDRFPPRKEPSAFQSN